MSNIIHLDPSVGGCVEMLQSLFEEAQNGKVAAAVCIYFDPTEEAWFTIITDDVNPGIDAEFRYSLLQLQDWSVECMSIEAAMAYLDEQEDE